MEEAPAAMAALPSTCREGSLSCRHKWNAWRLRRGFCSRSATMPTRLKERVARAMPWQEASEYKTAAREAAEGTTTTFPSHSQARMATAGKRRTEGNLLCELNFWTQ